MRNFQTLFQRGWTILHSYQQHRRDPTVSHCVLIYMFLMILSIFSYTFWWLIYLFCRNISSSPLLNFQNWTVGLSVVWLHISHRNWRQRLYPSFLLHFNGNAFRSSRKTLLGCRRYIQLKGIEEGFVIVRVFFFFFFLLNRHSQ